MQSPDHPDAIQPVDLAARLAARLCHDFISPVSAIVSGIDLIEDPEQQDMREEALSLITASARKLAALLSFSRIAFGGSTASEVFDCRELERLTRDFFDHARSELDWQVEPAGLNKPGARAILNLAQLGAAVLPVGGTARLSAREEGEELHLEMHGQGARARLRPEAIDGLEGRPFSEGLGGQWVQAFFLRQIVDQAAGTMTYEVEDGLVVMRVKLPLE
jgi:histidine phosphotransferase ChpT